MNNEAIYEDCFDDEELWAEFVERWINDNPDAVTDLVGAYLSAEVDDVNGSISIQESWAAMVEECVQDKIGEYEDMKYQEYKERNL
jgi:hypothetical protein